MRTTIKLFPAYGRSYQTVEAMVADFNSDEDFSVTPTGAPYTCKRELPKYLPLVDQVILMDRNTGLCVTVGVKGDLH
jgi:hypothetical protein